MKLADGPRVARLVQRSTDDDDPLDESRQFGAQIHRAGRHGQGPHADDRELMRILLGKLDEQLLARGKMMQRRTGKIGMTEAVWAVQLGAVEIVLDLRRRPQA